MLFLIPSDTGPCRRVSLSSVRFRVQSLVAVAEVLHLENTARLLLAGGPHVLTEGVRKATDGSGSMSRKLGHLGRLGWETGLGNLGRPPWLLELGALLELFGSEAIGCRGLKDTVRRSIFYGGHVVPGCVGHISQAAASALGKRQLDLACRLKRSLRGDGLPVSVGVLFGISSDERVDTLGRQGTVGRRGLRSVSDD